MNKIILVLGMSVGGWVGWWFGSLIGVMPAFVASVFGTAAGLFAARRMIGAYLP